MRFILALVLSLLATIASAGELVSNPDFTPSATAPKAGYLRAATSWGGTGQKNVGVVSGAARGLWLGVTTPVFNGSLSRTGWDVAPNTSQPIKVPAGCPQQTVTIGYGFVGSAPYPGQTNDLVLAIGSQRFSFPWAAGDHAATVTTSIPAGGALVDLSFSMGARQMTGGTAGIKVSSLSINCP